jgi:hypothetical protein
LFGGFIKNMSPQIQGYDYFVASSPQGSIFQTSWWLEAVAPGKYTLLLIKEHEEILAA